MGSHVDLAREEAQRLGIVVGDNSPASSRQDGGSRLEEGVQKLTVASPSGGPPAAAETAACSGAATARVENGHAGEGSGGGFNSTQLNSAQMAAGTTQLSSSRGG